MGTSNFVTKAVKHKRWQENKATNRSTKIQRATYHTALQNITGNFQHKYGIIEHLNNMNVRAHGELPGDMPPLTTSLASDKHS